MSDPWNDLLSCLELHPKSGDDEPDPLTFEGANQKLPHRRLFGGQLLAQFARVATATHPAKTIKSLHASFLREGTADTPVRYRADPLHDGRSFGALAVTATQHDRPIATCAISLHATEAGPDHQPVRLDATPPGPDREVRFPLLPWETRSVTDLDTHDDGQSAYDLWMRIPATADELAPALLAYASDLTVIGTALRAFDGVDQHSNGTAFTSATTSHTIWFHRPVRTGDWLLSRHHSVIVAHGRCFGRGDIFTTHGALVASFAQEALLRFRPGTIRTA
ncbi:acyl-CoA thioesterase [Nocardia sp. NPDC059177]|uniref:acyl-CoA thioesterase n=1 Tax=Nocardia sp. NPDC059177 TaxID=3346759 RepID=UPI0036B11C80